MALTKDQKQAQVTDLKEKLEKAESVMFAHYIGLNVAEASTFRSKLREGNAEMKVAKKTLLKLAAAEAGIEDIPDDVIDGPVSCIFSFEDPLSGAQVAFKYGKDFEQVELIGGIFEGKIISKEEALTLAQMPSKEELLAKFVSMLRSPLYSFAGICSSPLSGFARALSAIADKGGIGEEEESSTPQPGIESPDSAEGGEETAETPASDEAPAEEPATEETEAPEEETNETEESKDAKEENAEVTEEVEESNDSETKPDAEA